MGFAMTCSLSHRVFSNTPAFFSFTYSVHMLSRLSAVLSAHPAAVSMIASVGRNAVHHVIGQKKSMAKVDHNFHLTHGRDPSVD